MNEKKFSNILNPNQFYLAKITEDLEGNSVAGRTRTVNNMNEKSQFKSQLGKFNFDDLHKSPGVTAIVTSPTTPMSPQTPSTIKSRVSSTLSINTIASDDINDSDNNDIINNMTDNNNNSNDSNKTATSDTCGGASVKHNLISSSVASVIRTSSSSLSSQSSTSSSGTLGDISPGQMTGTTSCSTSTSRKTTKFQSFIQNQEANANFTLASAKSVNEQYHQQQQQKLIISSAYQRQLSQSSASNVTTSSSVLSSSYGAVSSSSSSSMFSPSQEQPQTPLTPQPQQQQFSFKNDYNRSKSMGGTTCHINNNSDFGGGGGLSLGNINEIKIVKSQQMNRKIAILSPNKHFSMAGSSGGVGGGVSGTGGGNSPGIGINRYGFEFFNEMTNNAGFTSSNL